MPKLIAATARIVAARKPTKRQRLARQRQAQAWQRKASPPAHQTESDRPPAARTAPARK